MREKPKSTKKHKSRNLEVVQKLMDRFMPKSFLLFSKAHC